METTETIRERRSVRKFTGDPVSADELDRLIEAARWAPSGLNNQPWRFMRITDRALVEELSNLTRYRGVVAGAAALIVVFLDAAEMYDRTKDLMSAGAAIQNILLAAHDMGLGACWLGEILARRPDVESLLETPEDLEFVSLIALGRPAPRERAGVRRALEGLIVPPPER
jgi:nitroreductase